MLSITVSVKIDKLSLIHLSQLFYFCFLNCYKAALEALTGPPCLVTVAKLWLDGYFWGEVQCTVGCCHYWTYCSMCRSGFLSHVLSMPGQKDEQYEMSVARRPRWAFICNEYRLMKREHKSEQPQLSTSLHRAVIQNLVNLQFVSWIPVLCSLGLYCGRVWFPVWMHFAGFNLSGG